MYIFWLLLMCFSVSKQDVKKMLTKLCEKWHLCLIDFNKIRGCCRLGVLSSLLFIFLNSVLGELVYCVNYNITPGSCVVLV